MTIETSSLTVDVRPGEGLTLSSGVAIELIQKSGQLARLRVTAPREVKIEKETTPRAKHGKVASQQ